VAPRLGDVLLQVLPRDPRVLDVADVEHLLDLAVQQAHAELLEREQGLLVDLAGLRRDLHAHDLGLDHRLGDFAADALLIPLAFPVPTAVLTTSPAAPPSPGVSLATETDTFPSRNLTPPTSTSGSVAFGVLRFVSAHSGEDATFFTSALRIVSSFSGGTAS